MGASRQADLYFASFTLPDFLNYLLAAGALSIVFIPIFLKYIEAGEPQRGWRAFSVIANFILVVGAVGIVLMMVFARPLAAIVAPGFSDPAEVETLVRLMRIILPAQFFHVLGGLLAAALMAQDRHALPAIAPLVYSAGIIGGGLVGAAHPEIGAEGFAWGVLVGSILGPMRRYPAFSWRSEDLRRYLVLSLPIMLGFSIVVVDEWIVKNQASYLAAGALSYLQYGRTLMKVPIGVFGMATGVASYPTVSRMVAAGDVVEAYRVLARAVRLMLVAILAAQVCLTIAGFEAVYVVWGLFSSRFTVADAEATAGVLVFLSLGLGGWAAQTVIGRGFYALGATWLPTLVGSAITVALIPLYVLLRQYHGADGLAVASSIAILVYVFLLGYLQRRRFDREARDRGTSLAGVPGMLSATWRLAVAAAVAIALGLAIRQGLVALLPGIDAASILLRGSLLCAAGIAIYAAVAQLLGVRELGDLAALLTRRLRRRRG
ncbi:MAG: murein biosynthesis integral membrane protein MurJ [Rhizobiales bacterium]|nr:murein biosynthesis integral membrane protein MurJ [Hyphomicrobiales bacterium]